MVRAVVMHLRGSSSFMRENPYPGIFIAVEGIDGSGKTEQARRIVRWLTERCFAAELTKEPSYLDGAQKLRQAITGQLALSPHELQTLFVQDRERHLVWEIIPQLGKKAPVAVVSDRYFLSTLAYGMAQGLTLEELWEMHQQLRHFVLPDLTVVIDVVPGTSLSRLGDRKGKTDIFEKEEMLARVRKHYQDLARMLANDHVAVVDGEGTPDEVFLRIKPHLEKLIATKYR